MNGIDVAAEPLRAKMEMGYVPDTPDVYEKLTGMQFINFMSDAYQVPTAVRGERVRGLLEVWRADLPQGVALGEGLFHTGTLAQLRAQNAPAAEMVERLSAELNSTSPASK